MVQVIVDRENQKSTVECSEVKGYVLGNGPSRAHINLDELRKDGIIYGCNALYRDFTPDYLFATDIGMIVDIFKDDYKGKCIFTDLDVTPIHFFDTVFEGIKMSLPPNLAIKIFYYGEKDKEIMDKIKEWNKNNSNLIINTEKVETRPPFDTGAPRKNSERETDPFQKTGTGLLAQGSSRRRGGKKKKTKKKAVKKRKTMKKKKNRR